VCACILAECTALVKTVLSSQALAVTLQEMTGAELTQGYWIDATSSVCYTKDPQVHGVAMGAFKLLKQTFVIMDCCTFVEVMEAVLKVPKNKKLAINDHRTGIFVVTRTEMLWYPTHV